MIEITNDTNVGDEYPATFSGDITLEKISSTSLEYKFNCVGLTENDFNFSVLKTEVGGSSIDYEKAFEWLMNQVEFSVASSNAFSDSMNIISSFDNLSSGIATLNISGDYLCYHDDTIGAIFELSIYGVSENSFEVEVPKIEAGNSSVPSAGDVFRWLMKKLKELVCPECL